MKDDYNFNIKRKRTEEIYGKVSDYFKGNTLSNYAQSKSLMRIQKKITTRALEILDLKNTISLILDAGCGPGFTSMYLKEIGYNVVALDVIKDFLYFYDIRDLNPIIGDMCFPPFKPNIFDAIISISALQWIYREINNEEMRFKLTNLARFFYKILKPHSKMIFQFYPKNKAIMESIGKIFNNIGNFKGNFIIDNPDNPKKRKIFLLLRKD